MSCWSYSISANVCMQTMNNIYSPSRQLNRLQCTLQLDVVALRFSTSIWAHEMSENLVHRMKSVTISSFSFFIFSVSQHVLYACKVCECTALSIDNEQICGFHQDFHTKLVWEDFLVAIFVSSLHYNNFFFYRKHWEHTAVCQRLSCFLQFHVKPWP